MRKSKRALFLGAALSGMVAGSNARAEETKAREPIEAPKVNPESETAKPKIPEQTSTTPTPDQTPTPTQAQQPGGGKTATPTHREKHACAHQNSCKGKGGCGATNGRNDCKGKGGCSTDPAHPMP